jgi:hypothetical protein
MNYPPTREEMRDVAAEDAEIRTSALLQAFAMPHITQDQMRQLIVDVIKNTYVGGFAAGWDSALEYTREHLAGERYRVR